MTRIVSGILTMLLLAGTAVAMAQESTTKVAIIDIQLAILESNDGQKAARDLEARFAPKQAELNKARQEIATLQDQLRNQETTLSDEARTRLLRTIDDKTRSFNRATEDAQNEMQLAEQDFLNEISPKMMSIIEEYARNNNFGIVLNVSSPQHPVLFAAPSTIITEQIVVLYNQATAVPAAAEPAAATPEPQAAPASASAPATTP